MGATSATPAVRRRDVLRFRFGRHQLDREAGAARGPTELALFDYGVQDTGPDGSAWALAVRGVPPAGDDGVALAWTLRGAPHAYRRSDLAGVAVATAPWSEADAAKRVFDGSRPLRAAGIPVLEALRTVAGHLRDIADAPMRKGEVSSRLTELVDEPYLRDCRSCNTTHVYEQTFRLAALQGGLELEPATSPPVLRRIPRLVPPAYGRLAGDADSRLDVVRNHLRFYAAARVRDVAGFLDAPIKEVRRHWPADAVEVHVVDASPAGRPEPRFVLAEDLGALTSAGDDPGTALRLVGPYDPFLQLRDRELLVGDVTRRKDVWRVLGRPGAIVAGGEIAGTWRPRTAKGRLTVLVEPWQRLRARDEARIEAEAERLAAHRGVTLGGISRSEAREP